MALAVLQGYTYGPINCGNCGGNYICIEETDDPAVVKLQCWEGHSATATRDHELIKQALGERVESVTQQDPSTIACPAPGCGVSLAKDDLRSQAVHMESRHPEIIAQRQRQASRW